jgi:hypothetical protein
VPVGRFQTANVDSQAPRDGGSYLLRIQPLAFDFAGFYDIGGQGL